MPSSRSYRPQTLAIRAGIDRSHHHEHTESIIPSSSFIFASAAEATAKFAGDIPAFTYARFGNPSVATFEKRIAALEGGECAIATSSGMSAIFSTIMGLLRSGDHIVASCSLFGSTIGLMNNYLPRYGIQTQFVSLIDPAAWQAAITPQTKLFFMETPSNPLGEIGDIAAIAAIAKAHGIILVVDNCFATPVLQQPLALGADIVVHSATKYIDGQGRCLGGAIVGDAHWVGEDIYLFNRTVGPTLSPFNAWVFTKGLETLPIRMREHCTNALALAQWLETLPKVKRVFYPGLLSHPQHELACTQMQGFGGVVAIEVDGGREGAWQVIDHCQLISITGNLGDVKSTITHPASTTHLRISAAERAAAGISEGLIRLSVGLEHIDDLKEDLAPYLT